MSDRFDLEQEILSCWKITTDVKLLYENVLEKDLTKDEIANFLLGLSTIYDMQFDKLFKIFEQLITERKVL